MKIRTQLIIGIILFFLAFLIVGSSVLVTSHEVEKMNRQMDTANRLVLDAHELSQISNDYILNQGARQRIQWEAKYAEFSSDLALLDLTIPEQQQQLLSLRADQKRLGDLFTEITQISEGTPMTGGDRADDSSVRASWSMMAVENQKIVFEASRLSDMIREESARVQKQQMLLVTVLFGTVLVLFIAITFFGIRRIIRSFSTLENGTAAIGSGNLDFRIDLTGDDEFHSLSTSFNAMAANMKSADEELRRRNEKTLAAYEQLAVAQQQYRDLFENVSIGILRSTPGPEGALIEANPAAIRIFEAGSREELLAVRPIDLYADPDQRRMVSDEIMAEGSIRTMEVQYRTLKGNLIWGKITALKKTSSDGQIFFDNTIEDITERKQAEDALRESEDRFRKIFENSPMGMVLVSPEFRFVSVNPAWIAMTGYSEKELLQMSFLDITHPEHQAGDAEHIRRLMSGKIPFYSTEKRYIRKDGSILWGFIRVTTIRDLQGKLRNLAAQIEDITDRKRADTALRESERRLGLALGVSQMGSWDLNLVDHTSWRSLRLDQIFGYDTLLPEWTIEIFMDYILPEDRAYVQERFTEALSQQRDWEFECRIRRSEGEIRWIWVRGSIQYDYRGEPLRMLGLVLDITERKAAENALTEMSIYNRSLIEASIDPLVTISHDGKIQDVNRATESATGLSRDDLIGTDFSDYFTEPDTAREGYHRVFSEGKVVDYPLEIRHRDGHVLPVLYNATVYRDSSGNIRGVFAAARDISEIKRAEDTLKNAHALLNETQEVSHLGGWEYDVTSSRITWTDEVYRIYGVERDFDPSNVSHDIQFYTPKDMPVISEAFRRCRELGEPYDLEVELVRADGRQIWVRTMGKADVMDGRVVRVHGNILDITDRKLTEIALRKSEEKYRLIAENTGDNIWIFDMDFRLRYISPSIEKMRGFSVEEALALPLDQHMTPESLAALVKKFNEEMEREASGTADPSRTVTFETEEYCKDGSTILVENSATLLRDATGRPHSILGISRDITDRKHAEDALQQRTDDLDTRNRLFSTLLNTIPIGIFMVEVPSGKPVIANAAAGRLLGRGILPDATRENLAEVYEAYRTGSSERYPPDAMPIIRGMRGECSRVDDMEVVHPDGTRALLEIFGAPVFDTHDNLIASLVCFLDITERKRAEEVRENLIRELAQKNTELDRFTYTVSHDLKSPLLSIRAYASLLTDDLKSGNTERVNLDIARISESAEKLENLITTLLTLSRSGRSVATPVRIPFADLTREAAALLETPLQARGIRLEIPASMPEVHGDRQRLFQVMTNLLDNAAKFMGDQKEPVIEVSIRPDATLPVICVQDNGMGIKKENLGKVFGLYERFNPEIPGTGIGLATVKRIIEAHGGTIWVESDGEGKGTTVCFTLPAAGEERTDNNNNA